MANAQFFCKLLLCKAFFFPQRPYDSTGDIIIHSVDLSFFVFGFFSYLNIFSGGRQPTHRRVSAYFSLPQDEFFSVFLYKI